MHLGLPRYDRTRVDGSWLDFSSIEDATNLVVRSGSEGRAQQPCIGPGRADLMVAGCAILTAICEVWPVGRLRVADRGVREGILANLMAEIRAEGGYQRRGEPTGIGASPRPVA
jgi:exopolyphosphatase/guanosine-5'-triphosphate,3'-diphosphate pyrophosphatase